MSENVEEMNANACPKDLVVPAPPFSWSSARSGLYRFCRRAYFYHYYAANAGGWEPHAEPWFKELFMLKHMRDVRGWLIDVLVDSAVEALVYHGASGLKDDDLIGAVSASMRKRLVRGFSDMSNGAWRDDPKRLNLLELYYGLIDLDSLRGRIDADARQFANALVQSGLAAELAAVEQLDWLGRGPEPLSIEGVKVWVKADFAWKSDRGAVNVVNVTGGRYSDDNLTAARMALSVLWASNRTHRPLDRIIVRSFVPDDEDQFSRRENVPITAAREVIRDGVAETRALVDGDGLAREGDFERSPACVASGKARCRFLQFCRRRGQ